MTEGRPPDRADTLVPHPLPPDLTIDDAESCCGSNSLIWFALGSLRSHNT